MAPKYPEEVDVFTVPHSRMKQLVHKYLDMVSPSNFSDATRMGHILEKLCHTFHVFKAHEQIENRFIMRRLKEKLSALDITDAAVCNCHSDNRLTEMLCLVLDGYRYVQTSERERIKYGLKLRKALEDFTQDFIPHMKEEEEVFQPMLIEYFSYDELKELKAKVIQQHQQKVDEVQAGVEKCAPECDSDKEEEAKEDEVNHVDQIPIEVMLRIMSHLSPKDLARCAQVSKHWNLLALDPSLWVTLYPVQWATGEWSFHAHSKDEAEVEETWQAEEGECACYPDDEDADRDESSDSDGPGGQADATLQQVLREVRIINGLVKHLLPRVGSGVQVCDLAQSRGLSSSLVHKILKLCPGIRTLNLAHTKITDAAFKEVGMKGGLSKIEHLDLSGCENITDSTLRYLTGEQFPAPEKVTSSCLSSRRLPSVQATLIDNGFRDEGFLLSSMENCPADPVINPDPSFTDLPLELCRLDCLDLCMERALHCSVQWQNRQKRDLYPLFSGEGRDVVVSCCMLGRTSCSGSSSETRDLEASCCLKEEGVCCSDLTFRGQGVNDFEPNPLHTLTHLSLNSCYKITDDGLRALSSRRGLPWLRFLDLSGCMNVTGEGLVELVDTCRSLDHSQLFYCDNLFPDPFFSTGSGCRNLECSSRICCRSGQ